MYKEIYTKKFKKDIKLLKRQGKNKDKLTEVLHYLLDGKTLPEKYKDHNLIGEWIGCRECHIEPDWLLIYQIDDVKKKVYLLRSGSHSNLFDEAFELDIVQLNKQLNEILN